MISLALNAAAIMLSSGLPVCKAPFAAQLHDRVSTPSLAGVPGLFEIPAAVSPPDRSTTFAFNNARAVKQFGDDAQRNAFLGFGFIPRLALIGRGTWIEGPPGGGSLVRDISVNAHLLLAQEGTWTPALAVGAQDFGGANAFFTNKYAVASKSLLGRARVSLGYGSGGYALNGVFGGIEVSPCSWITGIAENESHRRNFGARLSPLAGWGGRKGIEPTIDILWREGQGRTFGVGLRIQAASRGRDEQNGIAPKFVQVPKATRVNARDANESLNARLTRYGFENVRTARFGDTLAIAYENRVYNRDEWDALGIVMTEASHRAGTARVMRVTLLRVDLPVLDIVSGVAAFNDFVSGVTDRARFAAQLAVTNHVTAPTGAPSNSSRFRIDATVRPRVDQLILTNFGVYEAEVSLVPEARMHLGRGVSLSGRRAIVVHKTENFATVLRYPNVDQVLLHVARSGLPFSQSVGGLITQVSVGQFGAGKRGIAAEFDNVVAHGRVSLGGVVGTFGDTAWKPRSSVAYGSVRVRHAPLDLAFALTVGRFARGDVGATGEIERRFGLGEVAFFAQHTDFDATMAGVRVSVPLTFRKDPRPGPVRVRLPDYGEISHLSQVLKFNATRRDVANPLDIGGGMAKTFRGRDRLNAVRLMHELETLREAARRCGCS